MRYEIRHGLSCIIDISEFDCRREDAHCHIFQNHSKTRVATVNLNTLEIQGKDLDHRDRQLVYDFVKSHQSELLKKFYETKGER